MRSEDIIDLEDIIRVLSDVKLRMMCYEYENKTLMEALKKIQDKLLSYGETFDRDIHKQLQKECLKTIGEVLEKVK